MTEVAFHFNVTDKLHYACRLLRKIYRSGKQAIVTGETEQLDHLTRRLWEFDPLDFIPHIRLQSLPIPAHFLSTPLWLTEQLSFAPVCEVLINIGIHVPQWEATHILTDNSLLPLTDSYATYSKLIEIVSMDESDRAAARARWKHYAQKKWHIEKYEVAA